MFPGLFMIVSPALLLVRAKPLPILSRGNESLYHFRIDKVASELIQFRQPEVSGSGRQRRDRSRRPLQH